MTPPAPTVFGRFKRRLRAYAITQLGEPSTWRGVTLLLTSLGVALSPEQTAAIVALGLAVAGVIAVFIPDA